MTLTYDHRHIWYDMYGVQHATYAAMPKRLSVSSSLGLICLLLLSNVEAWDNNDLELFDLVEEVNQNFYDFLGIPKDASTREIRREYHKLSLVLHPDKNKEQGSDQKFRQLVGIYEVLKDDEKRQKYNKILEQGLPDWRQPVFYYRHARKLGLLELAILIFSIATVGHYLFAWTVYWERKYTLEVNRGSKLKKKDKKLKKNKQLEIAEDIAVIQEEIGNIPKPRFLDILPFKTVSALYRLALSLPSFIIYIKCQAVSYMEKYKTQPTENDNSDNQTEIKRPPRKKAYENHLEFYSTMTSAHAQEPVVYQERRPVDQVSKNESVITDRSVEWSREDLSALAKAVKKFPSGTFERWEKIAAVLNRSTNDVCAMAKQIRDTSLTSSNSIQHILKASQNEHSSNISKESCAEMFADQGYTYKSREDMTEYQIVSTYSDDQKSTEGIQATDDTQNKDDGWTQVQQKALEFALKEIPKGTEDRWDRIAEFIQTKTKEECIQRYKFLVEIIRKKNLATSK